MNYLYLLKGKEVVSPLLVDLNTTVAAFRNTMFPRFSLESYFHPLKTEGKHVRTEERWNYDLRKMKHLYSSSVIWSDVTYCSTSGSAVSVWSFRLWILYQCNDANLWISTLLFDTLELCIIICLHCYSNMKTGSNINLGSEIKVHCQQLFLTMGVCIFISWLSASCF